MRTLQSFLVVVVLTSIVLPSRAPAATSEVVVLVHPSVKEWVKIMDDFYAKAPLYIVRAEADGGGGAVGAKYRFEVGSSVEKLKDWRYAVVFDAPVSAKVGSFPRPGLACKYTLWFHPSDKAKPVSLVQNTVSSIAPDPDKFGKVICSRVEEDVNLWLVSQIYTGKGVTLNKDNNGRSTLAFPITIAKSPDGPTAQFPLNNRTPLTIGVTFTVGGLKNGPLGNPLLSERTASFPIYPKRILIDSGAKQTITRLVADFKEKSVDVEAVKVQPYIYDAQVTPHPKP